MSVSVCERVCVPSKMVDVSHAHVSPRAVTLLQPPARVKGLGAGTCGPGAMTTSLFLFLLLFLLRGHGAVNTFADFLGFCTSSSWCGLTWTLLEWSHLDLFSMIGTKKKSSVMYGCGHYRRVSGSATSTYLILLRILTHSAAVQESRGLSG